MVPLSAPRKVGGLSHLSWCFMLDWLKSWFGTDGKVVIHINSVVFPAPQCCHKPKPVPAPSGVVFLSGESVMAIKFPVQIPASPSADVVKTTLVYAVENEPTQSIDLMTNGGDATIIVPVASNGSAYANYTDAAGNVSPNTPAAFWTNASDTTPPESAAAAPTFGAGETVPD